MLLLSLLAGLALADVEECIEKSICGVGGQTLEGCDTAGELLTCQMERGQCAGKVAEQISGTCKTFEHGTMNNKAGIVYGPGENNFFFFTEEMSFQKLHDKAHKDFEFEEYTDVAFYYNSEEHGFSGYIRNKFDLAEIMGLYASLGELLSVEAHRDTFAPTMPPIQPWARGRDVYQKYGAGLADGADNRRPVGDPNQKGQRKMNFKKLAADTLLRLHWDDNIRTHNNGAVCYWELMIDGKRCPGEKWIRGGQHSQGNANNDHQTSAIVGLCAGIAAGDHTFQVDLYGNNRDCYTGWDPETRGFFMMEVREVKNGVYGYWGLTDRSKNQGDDTKKALLGRELSFTKEDHESDMRLFYYDNFRVYGHGKQCTWWIEIDGKDCKGGRIVQSAHAHGGENDHTPQAFAGYCVGGEGGLQGGNHKMTIRLETTNGADCYTGWESSFHMEAVEVFKGGEITYYQRFGNNVDGRDNGYVDHRVLQFTKTNDESHLRLFYSDNLRVHGNGKWCRWELRIDDKDRPCTGSVGISGVRHVANNENNHFPHTITGYCKGIKQGDHSMKVWVRGNSADCYTGWDSRSNNNFVMEVTELQPVVFRSGPY